MAKFIVGWGYGGEDPFVSVDDIVALDFTQVDLYDSGSLDEVVFAYLRTGHKIPIYVGVNHDIACRAYTAMQDLLDDHPIDLCDLAEKKFNDEKEKGFIPQDKEFIF